MIYLFLADGFEEIEALTPIDVLRRASLEVTTVGIGRETVVGAHGIAVTADIPDIMYRDAKPEMIILPGGMPGAENLDRSPTVDAAIRAAWRNGAYLCAICAAPMVLGKRNILNGKNAVCFPGFEKYLTGANVAPDGVNVVTDGKIITAKGMGAALEFSLALVTALKGKEEAEHIAASIFYDKL